MNALERKKKSSRIYTLVFLFLTRIIYRYVYVYAGRPRAGDKQIARRTWLRRVRYSPFSSSSSLEVLPSPWATKFHLGERELVCVFPPHPFSFLILVSLSCAGRKGRRVTEFFSEFFARDLEVSKKRNFSRAKLWFGLFFFGNLVIERREIEEGYIYIEACDLCPLFVTSSVYENFEATNCSHF